MKVAFIAVNYNNWYISANYVASVKAIRNYDKHNVVIIMVDNASANDDYCSLKQEINQENDVFLVRSEKNLGYFGGLNLGIRQIKYQEYDYVIIGNNDLLFMRNFLDVLAVKQYEKQQTVIVPDILTFNGIHQNPQFIDVPDAGRQLGYKLYYTCYPIAVLIDAIYGVKRKARTKAKKEKLLKSVEIFQCTGAIMLLRPLFYEHCGFLDNSLFLWGEEVALAHQLVEAGDKMLYDPELNVVHMESASVGKISSYRKYKLHQKSFAIYKHYYYTR